MQAKALTVVLHLQLGHHAALVEIYLVHLALALQLVGPAREMKSRAQVSGMECARLEKPFDVSHFSPLTLPFRLTTERFPSSELRGSGIEPRSSPVFCSASFAGSSRRDVMRTRSSPSASSFVSSFSSATFTAWKLSAASRCRQCCSAAFSVSVLSRASARARAICSF
eukprot:2093845-Pleurochrysis_carterae.AAC.2